MFSVSNYIQKTRFDVREIHLPNTPIKKYKNRPKVSRFKEKQNMKDLFCHLNHDQVNNLMKDKILNAPITSIEDFILWLVKVTSMGVTKENVIRYLYRSRLEEIKNMDGYFVGTVYYACHHPGEEDRMILCDFINLAIKNSLTDFETLIYVKDRPDLLVATGEMLDIKMMIKHDSDLIYHQIYKRFHENDVD